MITAVVDWLREEWSPEQISGFMASLARVSVSHQWIYSLVWDDKACGGDLWQCLRQPKRRSKHRAQAKSAGLGKIPNRVGIEHRPAKIDDRLTIGHWEGDRCLRAISSRDGSRWLSVAAATCWRHGYPASPRS
uniref:IS30 family transposase n=1 Tax=Halomonas piscis TaxID=3031727 RepID=UPI0035DA184A